MSRGFDNIHLAFVLPGASPVEQIVTSQSDKLSKLQQQVSGNLNIKAELPQAKMSFSPIFLSIIRILKIHFVCYENVVA